MSLKRSSEKVFQEEEPEFQVAPMIDVLLVLMTFFMSITSTEVLKTKTKLALELPVAKDSAEKKAAQDEIVINVAWDTPKKDGVIEIEEKTFSLDEVSDLVSKRKGNRPFFRVIIRAGEEVHYSFVQRIMSSCAAADVDNITFAVNAKKADKKYGAPPKEL